ncbi:unnamed protein product [Clonostachys rhizophaga]|uniref:Uncharacterized protein n=1 Tax=Clonostachys rhizophaga TaxID=160324 RepID=A0A9N9VZ79_9HYPO|nr:unnamed protein product [Clonostachys rhizophaga]
MSQTITDEDAIAAMEAYRVAKAELREYLEKENGPNGGRCPSTVPYRSEGDLSQAYPQFEAPDLRQGDAITSQPLASRDGEEIEAIKADELCKRLQGIPPDSDDRSICAPRPSARAGSETPLRAITDEDVRNYRKASEYGDYHLLVSDGARPAYSIEMVEAVRQNPDEHFELLYRWSHIEPYDTSPYQWDVFQRQLVRWEHFRDWQLRQRGKIDELSLEKFIEKRRTDSKLQADHMPEYRMRPITPSRPIRKRVYKEWRLDQRLRQRDRGFIRQEAHKPVNFAHNVEAIRRRLSENGSTSTLTQRSKASWRHTEYVDFELRWLSAYEAAVERAASDVEKTWQKYHEQGQFSKEETVQVLQSKTFNDQLRRQTDQRAEDQAAASEALTGLRQRIESHSLDMADGKLEMLQAAEERSRNADELYMRAVRKSAAVSEIVNKGGHQKYKELVAKQKALAQWSWDQLLLIEGENKLTDETGSVASGKRKARAVKLSQGSTSCLSPGRQGSLPPTVSDSVRIGEHKAHGHVSIPSTARRRRTGNPALQEAAVAQNDTGLSIGIMRLGVHSVIHKPKQPNVPEGQEASPPDAIKPLVAGKRKAESGDLSDSVGHWSKTQKVTAQNASRILDHTMTAHSLATLEQDASRQIDVRQVSQHDHVPGGVDSQEESTTAKTSHRRKRARTTEKMEASKKRLQSLREKPRINYLQYL